MTTKIQATSALRDALANLYPTWGDAERIVVDADLKLTAIAFDDKAVNRWHNILSEADKHHKVVQLIVIALAEYPANAPLQQASQAYLAATGQTLPTETSAPSNQMHRCPTHADSTDDGAERQALQDLLARHQRNLQLLQSKQAVYGLGETPLSLLNQLEHEEQEIARIKAELQKL